MKHALFCVKILFIFCLILSVTVFSAVIILDKSIGESYKVKIGDTLNIETSIPITAVYNGENLNTTAVEGDVGLEFEVQLKAFGIIPISTVSIEVVDEMQVMVLGYPFGMKLYTEGVLVIEISDVVTSDGSVNPANEAGLKVGDYIISVNGQKVYTNEDLSGIVENSGGEEMNFLVKRQGDYMNFILKAAYSSESLQYKIGIWIKDSSAGIGTLTFYSPSSDILCGLGHGICDDSTGEILQLYSGEVVSAEIISVEKGTAGATGQLKGKLTGKTLGEICLNCSKGVYSYLDSSITAGEMLEVAFKQEVENGPAKILCTVDGTTPKLYDCEIKIRNGYFYSETQNMVVTVTDTELLAITGGIVQGMSGSPIIQNGKLVGAVTHVLVDDPTRGYAIFAENMLEVAQSVGEGSPLPSDKEQLQEAS